LNNAKTNARYGKKSRNDNFLYHKLSDIITRRNLLEEENDYFDESSFNHFLGGHRSLFLNNGNEVPIEDKAKFQREYTPRG